MNKKNPLFVVTQQGKTVEEADHFFDAIIKKLGLEDFYKFLQMMIQILIDLIKNTKSFSQLEIISSYLNQLVSVLEMVIKKIDPVLAFSIFKH